MNRFFCWTDEYSARLLSVHATGMSMHQLQAKLGEVVSHESTREMSEADISSNIEQALKHGFREVTEDEFKQLQTRLQDEFAQKVIEPEVPNSTKVAWHEIQSEHEDIFQNRPTEYLAPNLQYFQVHNSPVHLANDLKLTFDSRLPTPQTAGRNLVFSHGLTIDGNFDAGDNISEIPLLVVVKGDLRAKNLILTGWTELIVTGHVVLDGILVAMDGEAGGRLRVCGDINAQQILGGMMYHIEATGHIQSDVYWCDDDEPSLANAKSVPCSLTGQEALELASSTPLVDEAYFVDSNWATGEEVKTLNVDVTQIVALLREGKRLFRQEN